MRARVLITRDAERAAALSTALHDAGLSSVVEPVTIVKRIADAAALPELSQVDWIAFTSANAVAVLSDILEECGRVLPADTRLAAVGTATAREVNRRWPAREIVRGTSTGADLARAILKSSTNEAGQSLLWPCAQESLPDFADELSAAGVCVIQCPVYATEAVPPWILQARLERPSSFDAVVFAAPSAVKSLREAWPEPWTFAAVAIGPTTAQALRHTGMAEPFVSRSPRVADIVAAILEALNGHTLPSAPLPITTYSADRR